MGRAGTVTGHRGGRVGCIRYAFLTYFVGLRRLYGQEPMSITVMGYALRGLGFAVLAIIVGCTALVMPRGGTRLILAAAGGAIFGSR